MWRLNLLGDLALQRGGDDLFRLRSQKYGQLLAYFALWPDRAHSRCEIYDVFWPDEPIENAQMCLRTAIASLKRQLDCPELLLPGHRDLIKLRPGIVSTDVHEFEQAVLDRDPAALRIYKGPLLPGCYYDWALDEANRLDAVREEFARSIKLRAECESDPKSNSAGPTFGASHAARFRLPSPTSTFYGRERELCELQGHFEGNCRLLTLVGLGGIGKTRLAMELARSFPTRVAMAEFAAVERSGEIPNVIGAAIHLSRVPSQDFVERLQVELGQEPTLLVLDNLEELAESNALGFVEDLLMQVSSLRVLATSRIPLGLKGEHIFSLSPLSNDAARSLFLDRARCLFPDFAESGCLSDLCDRLDCLPLAIELCATWAPLMSSRKMLDALSDRFQWLEARRRHLPERHRSLAAVLRWTCPPDGKLQRPLRDLSVIFGRWNFEAAEAVLGSGCIGILDRLQDRALIQVHVEGGEPSFSILQTVREYALEGRSEADLRPARERHCRYYCRVAVDVARSHGSDAQGAFQILDLEQQNIFAAFEFGLDQSEDVIDVVLQAFEATRWCWWVRGYETNVRQMHAKIANLQVDRFHGVPAGLVMRAKANHALNDGRLEDALESCRDGIQIWEEIGDCSRLSEAQRIYAVYLGQAGRYEESEAMFQRHLTGIREDDRAYMIGLASLAAMLVDSKKNYDKAVGYYDQMIAFWQTVPDGDSHVAVLKTGLAACFISRGEFRTAEDQLRSVIPTLSRYGERIREALAWDNLAIALDGQGKSLEAVHAQQAAANLRTAALLGPKSGPLLA